jgi:thioredoxin 1
MTNIQKGGIIAAVVIAVVVVFAMKQKSQRQDAAPGTTAQQAAMDEASATAAAALPQLIDLGAKKCVPCKMMEPILEDLKQNYSDRFTTIFYDVWENKEPAQQYGIRSIPTQIFQDAEGKELYRHEGFISKEDILKKWQELGVELDGASSSE